jgi:hypothetical protein
VPVIVNAILNEHQIVVDIVAFVNKGDFPRSRLGEKQRGKILASWVTRKMRTMAQFGIRDADAALAEGNEGAEPRIDASSVRNSSIIASSLRNVETAPQLTEANEADARQSYVAPSPPPGVVEMPVSEYREIPIASAAPSDNTPTEARPGSSINNTSNVQELEAPSSSTAEYGEPGFGGPERHASPMPPQPGPKPPAYPPPPLPGLGERKRDTWTLPSQRPVSHAGSTSSGALKVANPTTEEDWGQEAMMHMNLAGRRDLE